MHASDRHFITGEDPPSSGVQRLMGGFRPHVACYLEEYLARRMELGSSDDLW